jgi:hypothetical protein
MADLKKTNTSKESIELAKTFLKMLGDLRNDEKWIDTLCTHCDLDPLVLRDEQALARRFEADTALPARLWQTSEEMLQTDWPRPFWLVLREELKEIAKRRRQQTGTPPEMRDCFPEENANPGPHLFDFVKERNLAGLAFSGGGIRSATFNLGVLQALAEFGLLPRIDYLSTVSGGGYIGAWFTAWMRRIHADAAAIERHLSPKDAPDPSADSQKPIRFLRKFSNYLTPTIGITSFDTWTMAAIYSRNLILNLLTLIAGFGALLILPRLFGALIYFTTLTSAYSVSMAALMLPFSAALLLVSVASMASCLSAVRLEDSPKPGCAAPLAHVRTFCVWPLLGAISIASPFLWKYAKVAFFQSFLNWWLIFAFVFFLVLSLVISLGGGFLKGYRPRSLVLAVVSLIVPTVGSCLFYAYIALLQYWKSLDSSGIWHATVFGPPALLNVLALTCTLQIGLLGIDFPDVRREWLGRLSAVTNFYTVIWVALFSASIYGPLLVAKVGVWVASASGIAWLTSTIGAVLAGKSAKTGQTKDGADISSKIDLIAKLGPPIFIVGFVLLVSFALHLILYHSATIDPAQLQGFFPTLESQHWTILNEPHIHPFKLWNGGDWPVAAPLFLAFLLSGSFAVLVWRVDINEFSMHHFYKNRLVRCYLGATNLNRRPDPFTGLDANDDLHLQNLRQSDDYKGPYHIVNATLNLSAGSQLAWQERQAASFVFTPLYSGFELSLDTDHPGAAPHDAKFCAYRKTGEYAYPGGIHLGTAISISGAAADPNQGYNTSPAVAFLMTLFDVRLGWWLGNPRKNVESKLSSPRFGLVALLSELFGYTDDRNNFVNLSDGGHFDNMGIYELVRRRCKYIILSDAEQDGAYTFSSLGMAIRKCRVDFGANIEIDPKRIVPLAANGRGDAHCAVGKIKYAEGFDGTLVYIKSSLIGDEPEDVLQYAAANPAFPHESFLDQWFTESQFEATAC